MRLRTLASLAFAAIALCTDLLAQQRTVAVTVDDLPYAGRTDTGIGPADATFARSVNNKLFKAFRKHSVPVTGFANEKRSQSLSPNAGLEILREWVAQGFDLGNHTYSHPDINGLSVPEVEDEIVRGETSISALMKSKGKRIEFFRFPMNHTGDSKAKHDDIASFLAQRGYRLATCTIDNSDYLFNDAYVEILAQKDSRTAKKLRRDYVAYTSSEIDYYASLNKQVLGYEPPQVMLLHDNRLNADVIEELLRLFESKGYKFVNLRSAQSDPAYSIPETYITPYGPMWGYRWAKERNVPVTGRLEPEPPDWLFDLPVLSNRSSRPHQGSRKN